MLGHQQVSFTMQTYMHVLKETQQDLADKMDAILKAPESERVAPQVAPLSKNRSVN